MFVFDPVSKYIMLNLCLSQIDVCGGTLANNKNSECNAMAFH